MKTLLAILRLKLKFDLLFGSEYASRKAIRLFMKTRKKKESAKESQYYELSHHFTAEWEGRQINCYESGYHFGPLVLLVHGWESNAGSMAGIADILGQQGYHVVTMDLPAHGRDKGTHTNLFECKEALKAVIKRIAPAEEFSVVAHSFGSMVSAFALSESNYKIDKLVYLTAPNRVEKIFKDYAALMDLNADIYAHMVDFVEGILGNKIEVLEVDQRTKGIQFNELRLFHDPHDKVISFSESEDILRKNPEAELVDIGRTGHYRMLWHHSLISRLDEVFMSSGSLKPEIMEHSELLIA